MLKTSLLTFVIGLLALPVLLAQSERQLFVVHEDQVIPGMMDDYMELMGEVAAAFKAKGNEMESTTYTREDFSVIHVTPIESMADLDRNMSAYFSEMMGEEEFKQAFSRFDKHYHQHGDYVVALNEELSYMPEGNLDPTTPGQPYRLWQYYTVSADNHDEVYELAKEMKALHKNSGSKLNWRIYEPVLGIMGPQFVVVMSGKNAAELENRMSATKQLLKGKDMEIGQQILKLTIEYRTLRGERVAFD